MELTKLQERLLDESLHELGLPVRITNGLDVHAHVRTVRELLMKRPEEILALPNFGDKTLEAIFKCLEKYGFKKERPNGHGAADLQSTDARRDRVRAALGGSAGDDWDAEILYEKARKGRRKRRRTGDE